jgi:amino acid permease
MSSSSSSSVKPTSVVDLEIQDIKDRRLVTEAPIRETLVHPVVAPRAASWTYSPSSQSSAVSSMVSPLPSPEKLSSTVTSNEEILTNGITSATAPLSSSDGVDTFTNGKNDGKGTLQHCNGGVEDSQVPHATTQHVPLEKTCHDIDVVEEDGIIESDDESQDSNHELPSLYEISALHASGCITDDNVELTESHTIVTASSTGTVKTSNKSKKAMIRHRHHQLTSPLSASLLPTEDPLAPPARRISDMETILSHLERQSLLIDTQEKAHFVRETVNNDDPVSEYDEFTWGAFLGSVANLCSATLGAGVLALPYAFYQAGLVMGLLLLFLSAIATLYSIHLMALACHRYRMYTYETLVQVLFGTKCRQVVQVCIFCFCIGCAVAYLIAVGDIMTQSHMLVYHSRSWSMILVWTLILVPLSMVRRMQQLQCASGVGLASIGTLIFLAGMHLLTKQKSSDSDNTNPLNTTFTIVYLGANTTPHDDNGTIILSDFLWPANGIRSVLTACPIVLFAFSCQVNVCAIYHELPIHDDHKHAAMMQVATAAVSVCSLLYASVSLIGLADFGAAVPPNLLSAYGPQGSMQIASGSMAVAILLAFPLNIFPARITLQEAWAQRRRRTHRMQQRDSLEPHTSLTAALLEDQNPLVSDNEDDAGGITQVMDSNGPDEADPLLPPPVHLLPITTNNINNKSDTELMHARRKKRNVWIRHILLTLVLTVIALVLALLIPNISIVFGLLGGTTTSILGFVVPGALGIRNRPPDAPWWHSLARWTLLCGGLVVGVLTTFVTVTDTFR